MQKYLTPKKNSLIGCLKLKDKENLYRYFIEKMLHKLKKSKNSILKLDDFC